MFAFLALAGGYFLYQSFRENPDNSMSRDKSVVPGSDPASHADATRYRPVIYTTSEVPGDHDSRNTDAGPADMRVRTPRYGQHLNGPYQLFLPNGQFQPEGLPGDQVDNFIEASAISDSYHATHTASVPVRGVTHRNSRIPPVHTRGRAMGHLGPAVVGHLGTIAIAGNRPEPHRLPYSVAAMSKSLHAGTLIANTVPPYAYHNDSAHKADSLFTRIKTGRAERTTL